MSDTVRNLGMSSVWASSAGMYERSIALAGIMVKRILRQHGYPPDKQEAATATVLAQAELLCADWAG